MNHCIDVICVNCGYSFCALGCKGSIIDTKLVRQAFADLPEPKPYRYSSHVCKECGEKQVYEARVIEEAVNTIRNNKKKEHVPNN